MVVSMFAFSEHGADYINKSPDLIIHFIKKYNEFFKK